MDALPAPVAEPPVLFGVQMPAGELLPWSGAVERLVAARTYWIATTRPDGSPHTRPVWGVWLSDGFWFSTGSLARKNVPRNPEITVHLDTGDRPLIVEGTAEEVADRTELARFVAAYNPKYDWDCAVSDDGWVSDSSGAAGPAFRVRPRRVLGWETDMRAPTRWRFPAS
ncbi:pyridoxamine 5'-phosphate oxidase family protein [Streptomyces sp. B-S-A8]|uniref:Pyridoxamine 5'-phosphate oxidase family protein n=1 Tax=Streptomyces solicavernae TaxID=3043614 RepID=A0ABT6RQ02_9ACTN|nr:pyridoxamine 5'-phosphate oxidase family protein [Streptomyces sp. B-S-A8]MDI3386508.1 pyridoxamine 5'-phosphate oxidase family protein [Streptomyces sp. B-S-A8]